MGWYRALVREGARAGEGWTEEERIDGGQKDWFHLGFFTCVSFSSSLQAGRKVVYLLPLWLKTVCWGFINQICCQGFVSAPAIPCFLGGR